VGERAPDNAQVRGESRDTGDDCVGCYEFIS
jgi:hypothetical protein